MTFGDLWWPDLKNDQNTFVMIFDSLSNAAYNVSVHGPEEPSYEGVSKYTPRRARSAPSTGPARVNLFKFWVLQSDIHPDGFSIALQLHFTIL